MNLFKRAVIKGTKIALKPFGINLDISFAHKQEIHRVHLLKKLNINLVADVGANIGQYALELIKAGYNGNVISFEPVEEVYNQLLQKSKGYENWSIYDRCALGQENGQIEINVSKNLESSSIYPVLDKSIIAEPTTQYIRKEKVNILRLDKVLTPGESDKIHLKIDVQGFEENVLIGSESIIDNIISIELEISLIPLYENALSPEKLLENLSAYGFAPVFYIPVFVDPDSGGILQLNGFFVKKVLLKDIT